MSPVPLGSQSAISSKRWIDCRLTDACVSMDYGLTASATDDSSGVKFLRITDIVSGHINWDTVPYVTVNEEIYRKYQLRDGDIVIARTGASTGASAFIQSPPKAVFASYLVRLNIKPKFDSRFLAYYLKSEEFWSFMRGVLGDKSAQPNASASTMGKAPLLAPELKTDQRRIAHILGALDDKIELNRRMNSTLEEMAQALFKSWFVDFEPVRAKMEGRWRRGESLPGMPAELYELFPEQLLHSALGDLPEGWEVKRVNDVAEQVAMGPFGSSIKVSTFVDDGIPVINGRHLKGTRLEDIDYRFITEDHAQKLAKANVFPEDIVLTHRGNIGQVSYIPTSARYDRYVVSQSQFYLRCDPAKISPLFVLHFFKTPEGQHQLLANSSSTGVPSIARPVTYLRSIEFCVPPKGLWSLFDSIVRQFHLRAGWNSTESSTLAALRDALLPKLVSGQL